MSHSINVKGRLLSFDKPLIMGIINTTPDSFYSGSRIQNVQSALESAEKMLHEGATILDIGGYSSRPGADDIDIEVEIERVKPVIESIKKKFPESIISIDTFRSEVARIAIDCGADIINDISAGSLDDKMFQTVANLNVPYIMMHMRGTPQDMKSKNNYENLLIEVIDYFNSRINELLNLGVNNIIVDPGFGFAKNISQNFELLKNLKELNILDRPILVGLSRKSMIYKSLDITSNEALNGTTVLNTLALERGAKILRVHDVKKATEVVKLIDLMYN